MASTWLLIEMTVARTPDSRRWFTQAVYSGPIRLR